MDFHNNYGATRSNPPPPYTTGPSAGLPQFSGRLTYVPTAPASPRFASEPREPKKKGWTGSKMFTAIVTFAFTVALCLLSLPVTSCNDPLDPAVRDRIREEWSKEVLVRDRWVAKWEDEQARWKQEEAEHANRLRQWQYERIQHQQEIKDRAARVAKWEHEKAQWEQEEAEHAELVREWEYERIQHQRELKDRAAREEDERIRLNLFWGSVQTHQCTTYGTMEYTATLMNLPAAWEHGIETCKATPLELHGISYFPHGCEDYGSGVVIGRWLINQQEPYCTTFWEAHKDKGCTSPGSGMRRIEHHLMDIPDKGDWREFCASTPIWFDGMHFPGAQQCYNTIWGVYGQWDISDSKC